MTPLFLTEVPEFSVRGRIGARGIRSDPDVPREGRVVPREHQRRGEPDVTRRRRRRPAGDRAGAGRAGMRGNSATVVMSYSMVKLPETPMMPRLFDERVGYFTRTHCTTTAATITAPSSARSSPAIGWRRGIRTRRSRSR